MIDQNTLKKLHDSLQGTDADIAYGQLRHIIEAYLKAATLSDHHVGLVLSNVMYKAQSRATQQRCVKAIADLRAAGCLFVQCPKGGSDD